MNTDKKNIVESLNNTQTLDLFTKTFKDDAHLEGILIKMAQDAYSRIEKKFPKT
jgi:hypothetical protein